MPTNESYSHGIRHLQYGHFTAFEVAPEVFHFVQVAMQNAPNKLVELLDIATENYSPNNLTGTVFSATTACLFWRERVVVGSSIIQSKNQFIQGFICGQIYSELINEELSFEDAITQLACLTVDQRLIALSFWIYDLRIAINRNQMDKIKIGLTKKTFGNTP